MQSGRAQFVRETALLGAPGAVTRWSGAQASPSDSILEDFRVPNTPIGSGRRQTQAADLRGASIPCLLRPYETEHFLFWNQSVAVEVERGSRQLKIIGVSLEQDGLAMATLSSLCASLLYGDFSGSLQTYDAVSMANPEVSKCR